MKPDKTLLSRGMARLRGVLASPVDGASLAVFRICFGMVMAYYLWKQLVPRNGLVPLEYLITDWSWHFRYPGFEWVRVLPEPLLKAHYLIAGAAGLCVALGLFYRAAAVLLFVSYLYVFLIEATQYNNHYYLMCLLCFLLIWMPANRRFSLDSLIRSWRGGGAGEPRKTIPFWPVFLLRFELFVMYFYGGLAKINSDWLTGEPLFAPGQRLHAFFSHWLPFVESLEVIHFCLFLAWGGLFYDLSVGVLLLFRRTRLLAIGATFLFHLHNHFIFPIGVFPFMAFTATLIFFEPDWPQRLTGFCRGLVRRGRPGADAAPRQFEAPSPGMRPATFAFVCCFIGWQLVWPLRHHFVQGDANWTEEGQDFSWRMMLRAKAAGQVTYFVEDPAIHTTDSRGRPQIDWERCPEKTSRAVYVAVDSHAFNWSHHPGLTMTFEPVVGSRIIYNPAAEPGADEPLADGRSQIAELWRRRFGREPRIRETISVRDALHELRAALVSLEQDERPPKGLAQVLAEIDRTVALVEETNGAAEMPGREPRGVRLANRLHALASSNLAPVIQPVLSRLHPFAFQGASFGDARFLVVDDPTVEPSEQDEMLWQLSNEQPYLMWLDMSRLRPTDWRKLPESFATLEARGLRVIWNHFRDMNVVQLDRFSAQPFFIRQYAQHIAQRWQSQTGRRPEVRVHSLIMLNYHVPQPLIDSEVDLASTSYVFHRHNPWILPHVDRALGISKMAQPKKTLR